MSSSDPLKLELGSNTTQETNESIEFSKENTKKPNHYRGDSYKYLKQCITIIKHILSQNYRPMPSIPQSFFCLLATVMNFEK